MGKTMTKTSNRQTKANRQNAAKSTGPRTAEGKGRSRLNALKHGLRAEQVVVLGGPNPEDPQEFEALRDGLIDDRKPIGALEELLVEQLAVGFWRLRRAYRFEAESIAQANRISPVSKMLDDLSGLPPREPVEHLLPKVQNLDRLVRYESMIDRELLRSMALLQRLQQRRKLDEEPSNPFDTAPPSDPPAKASARVDRRSEKGEGSRKCGFRIADCGMESDGSDLLSTGSEPRTTDHEKTPVAERTHRRARHWNAMSNYRSCHNWGSTCALGSSPKTQGAAGFSSRGSVESESVAYRGCPRGLKVEDPDSIGAHGSRGKRKR